MNNKGFTLVELLATISLLAILMMIAIPNVAGVVNRNKNKTYVEDAKKMVSLAEYKVRSNPGLYKPTGSRTYCFRMSFLSDDEFDSAPNGGCYDKNASFVKVSWNSGKLNYMVQIVERKTCDVDGSGNYTGAYKAGIILENSNRLFDDDATTLVTTSNGIYSIGACNKSF